MIQVLEKLGGRKNDRLGKIRFQPTAGNCLNEKQKMRRLVLFRRNRGDVGEMNQRELMVECCQQAAVKLKVGFVSFLEKNGSLAVQEGRFY